MFLGNPLTAQVLVPPTLTETSLINPVSTNMQWILYPNPATSQLQITGLKTATNYTISSMIGAKLQSGTTAGSIDITKLPTGVYTIGLLEGTRKETFRFTKP